MPIALQHNMYTLYIVVMIYVELFYVLIFPMVLNATPELGRD